MFESDIIVASPIAIATKLAEDVARAEAGAEAAAGGKRAAAAASKAKAAGSRGDGACDFLSSIEVLVVDRADVLAMQVGECFLFVLGVWVPCAQLSMMSFALVRWVFVLAPNAQSCLSELCFAFYSSCMVPQTKITKNCTHSPHTAYTQAPTSNSPAATLHMSALTCTHSETSSCMRAPLQNWAHIETVVEALNRVPREQHGVDIMRVREWHLSGWARHYRQTVLLTSFLTPDMNAVLGGPLCTNYRGRLRVAPVHRGVLGQVIPQVQQVFERFTAPTPAHVASARFDYFTKTVWPRLREGMGVNGLLLFVPSYFDFIRWAHLVATRRPCWCSKECSVLQTGALGNVLGHEGQLLLSA